MPPDQPVMSAAEELRSLKRVLIKLGIVALNSCMVVHKFLLIVAVLMRYNNFFLLRTYIIYLCVAGIVLHIPMFYSATAVRGHNVFLVCAAGSLVMQGAEFFLFLLGAPIEQWIIGQVFSFFSLFFLLAFIEISFREKNRLQNEEEQRLGLSVVYYNVELVSEVIGENSD
ncbi:unnamed protein product [Caenorhabditis brenneri]